MRRLTLALCAACTLAQPVSEAEARRILQTPLARTVGAAEAERVQRLATLHGLLMHCRWAWERSFERLAAQHREGLRRSEAEMHSVTVWHGFWQGRVAGAMRQERPECSPQLRAGLRA